MIIVGACGHKWERKSIPCPDGIYGCLVAHYSDDDNDWICPECGHDASPKGPMTVKEEIGTAVINLGAIKKLNLD